MGLLGTSSKPLNKAESLKILGDKISEENLSFLAELAQKPSINEKIKKNKFTIKTFL